MNNLLRPAIVLLLAMTVITGMIYPAVVTGAAQLLFAHAANGSLIVRDGKALGSALIGQPFADPKYFWSRPSATSPFANNSASSGASNLGPTNSALSEAVRQRIEALRTVDAGHTAPASSESDASESHAGPAVPADLVTASASGLDPHISPAAAQFQVARVARARGIDVDTVTKLVVDATEGRQLGVLGEPRVNVLRLNLALDAR